VAQAQQLAQLAEAALHGVSQGRLGESFWQLMRLRPWMQPWTWPCPGISRRSCHHAPLLPAEQVKWSRAQQTVKWSKNETVMWSKATDIS